MLGGQAAAHACAGAPQPQQPGFLDPANNMPREPNQRPWAGQAAPISTQRTASTIPKGGTEATWVYPSPQMFYNGEPMQCFCDLGMGRSGCDQHKK